MSLLSLEQFTASLAQALHARSYAADSIQIALNDQLSGEIYTPRFWAAYQSGQPFPSIVQTVQDTLSTVIAQSSSHDPSGFSTITPQQLQPHLIAMDTLAPHRATLPTRVIAPTLAEILVADFPDHVQWMTYDRLTAHHWTPEEAWALADQNRATRANPGKPLPASLALGGSLWRDALAADQAWDTVRDQPGSLFFAPATEFAYAWPGGALEPLTTLVPLHFVFSRLAAMVSPEFHGLIGNAWVVQPHHCLLDYDQFLATLLQSDPSTP